MSTLPNKDTQPQGIAEQIKKILTHDSMVKVIVRAKTQRGDKPEEVHLPWNLLVVDASDKTVAAIQALINSEVRKADERFVPLRKYLSHYGTCSYIKEPLSDTPCTCGLDDALTQSGGTEK